MTSKKNTSVPTKPSKKEARRIIAEQLEKALPELRMALGEKKFLSRVKKAAKILGEDFALLPAETEETVVVKEKSEKVAPAAPKKAKVAKKVKAAKKASAKKVSSTDETSLPAETAE